MVRPSPERVLAAVFPVLERVGLHLTRNHFYEPIPDTRRLPDRLWEPRRAVPGIDLREEAQLELLERIHRDWATEYVRFRSTPGPRTWEYYLRNPQFGKVDAEVLYAMIRSLRPRRVLEVGGGHSTTVACAALERNRAEGAEASMTTVEPCPSTILRAGVPGLDELIVAPVQDVPIERFLELGADDILFIDSSHVVKVGSDVQYLLLDVLPRLAPGVVVHVHDIFLPGEYPRHLVVEWHRFWNEQYVLQAFLACNPSFEVLWGSAFLHTFYPEELARVFPSYRREGWPSGLPPSSFWIRRVA